MSEYILNILSFHYNVTEDNTHMSLKKRIDIIEETLHKFTEHIKFVICSEFYLCNTNNQKISISTEVDKKYIIDRFIGLSSKYKDIVFLPGTYYLLNRAKNCYNNILPIFYNGYLKKEYIKFMEERTLSSDSYDDTLIKTTDKAIHSPTAKDTCTISAKTIMPERILFNIIPELDNYNYLFGICSDSACPNMPQFDNDKQNIQLYVAYEIGTEIKVRNTPVVIIDAKNKNIRIDFNGSVIRDGSTILKSDFLNIDYLRKIIVKQNKVWNHLIFFTITTLINKMKDIKDKIPDDIKKELDKGAQNKFIKTQELLNDSINDFENVFTEELATKSTDSIFITKLAQYHKTKDILKEYNKQYDRIIELYNKKIQEKYLKYKMKYIKLKNLN
jgi:hypothetical protein